jgi:hypothetical protein
VNAKSENDTEIEHLVSCKNVLPLTMIDMFMYRDSARVAVRCKTCACAVFVQHPGVTPLTQADTVTHIFTPTAATQLPAAE